MILTAPSSDCRLEQIHWQVIILSFYFEITADLKLVAKYVQGGPLCSSPSSPEW